jgi:Protein of unknown function (DUF433)
MGHYCNQRQLRLVKIVNEKLECHHQLRLGRMSLIEETEIASLPITVDPNILGGTPGFRGTRVPVEALFSNLEAGVSIKEFGELSHSLP